MTWNRHAAGALSTEAFGVALAILVGLAALAPAARAVPGGREDWATTLKINGAQLYGMSIAVDAADDLYVVGSNPFATVFTAKLDRAGNVLWQVEYDHAGTREQGDWVALDPASGHVLVSGHLVSGGSQSPSGFVTVAYDAAGTLLWSDVTSYTHGRPARMAVDGAGNVYVVGTAWLTNSSGNTTDDLVTMKFSAGGTKLWTRTAGVSSTSIDAAGALRVDAAGNVWVTGGTIGTNLTEAYDTNGNLLWSQQSTTAGTGWDIGLAAGGEIYVCSGGASQVQVLKYDAAGQLLWSNGYTGVVGTRLALDSAGNVVVIGYQGAGGYLDWITHKIAPDGSLLWSATYDHLTGNDEVPYALALGPDDEIYVTGQGGPDPTHSGFLRTVTMRYSPDGVEQWAVTNSLSLRGRGVVRLSDNSVATVGESTFTVFHDVQTGVFTSLDGALAGGAGTPRLRGTGVPAAGNAVSVELGQAVPSAPLWLVVGLARLDAPFMGGTLVPMPDLIVGGLATSPAGLLSLPATWPAGLPSGFEIYLQAWIVDPAAPRGLAASNALLAVSE